MGMPVISMTRRVEKNRSFSVELHSKANLKNVNMADGGPEPVLIEGTIGELYHAGFREGVIFEVVGSSGAIRIDLGRHEVRSISKSPRRKANVESEKGMKAR